MTVPVLRYRIVPTGTLLRARVLPVVQISAAAILAQIKTVDGVGSGLDADLLDGQSGAHYLDRANHTGTQTLSTISDAGDLAGLDDLSTFTTSNLAEGANLYFTDERAQDAVGSVLVDSSEINFTYDDATPQITAAIVAGSIDETKLDASVNASLDLADSALQSADIGVSVQAYSANLDEFAAVNPTAAGLALLDDTDAAEQLTTLGFTATITELNYTDGVTSAIQTQLDGKQALDSGLTDIAGLAVTDGNFIVGNGTNWVAESGATARTSLGLGTGDSPQFTAVNVGHASDTTVTRVSAGVIAVEGVTILTTSGTATLTNKTIDANGTGNSISNLEVADFAASAIVTEAEGIGSNDNDTTIPTSAAVKAYADSVIGGGGGGLPGSIGPNLWINGNFDHWQKGPAMAAPAAVGGYQADFFGHRGAGSTVFVEREEFTLGQTDVPGNPRYFCRVTVDSSAGASNLALMASDIDGVQNFNGSKSTLSFWAKADGNKNIAIEADQYFGSGGSPSSQVLISPQTIALTTSWQRFDVVIEWPSVAGKTLGTSETDTDRIGVIFWLDAGSNWNARTNSLGQQDGIFDFARISLRHDPDEAMADVADPLFDYDQGADFMKCLELLQVFTDTELVWSGYVESGGNRWLGVPARVPMKRTPVPTLTKTGNSGFTGSLSISVNRHGAQILGTGTSTINNGFYTATLILDANHPYTP